MTKPECRMTDLRLAHHARLIFVGRLCRTPAFHSAFVGLPVSVNIFSRSTCSRSMASTAGAIFSNPPSINPPTLYESWMECCPRRLSISRSCFRQPRRLGVVQALPRTAQFHAERYRQRADVRLRRHSAAFRKSTLRGADQSKGSLRRVNTCALDSTTNRFAQRALRTLWLQVRGYLSLASRESQSA